MTMTLSPSYIGWYETGTGEITSTIPMWTPFFDGNGKVSNFTFVPLSMASHLLLGGSISFSITLANMLSITVNTDVSYGANYDPNGDGKFKGGDFAFMANSNTYPIIGLMDDFVTISKSSM